MARKKKMLNVGGRREVQATEEDIERERLNDEIVEGAAPEASQPLEVGDDQRLYENQQLEELGYSDDGLDNPSGEPEGRSGRQRTSRGRKVA